MTGRIERVDDDAERAQLRAKARRMRTQSAIAAVAAALATLALP